MKERKGKKKNFIGVPIFAGIDVHKDQWNVAIYIGKRFHKVFQQEPDSYTLYRYLSREFPKGTYICCYEAGCFGFVASREFANLGVDCLVVNAADIPTTDKEKRRKTDRIDSKKLGKCLANDLLESIYIPTEQLEADREIVRYRRSRYKCYKKCTQRLKAFLLRKGRHKEVDGYERAYWSLKRLKAVASLRFSACSDKQVLDELIEDLQQARKSLAKANKAIIDLSKTAGYATKAGLLRSIPGVGILTCMTLLTELGEMERFKSLACLCSYCGIVPDVRSSADKTANLGLTPRANHEIRRLLVQCAWKSSCLSPRMAATFHQSMRKHQVRQKAIIKVARKLLSVIRAIWTKEEVYIENPGSKQAA